MDKLDLRKELKQFYTARKKPSIIDVPEARFIAIAGRGEPGGEAYQAALNALYSVAYTVKFNSKKQGRDFTVMPLESLWWWDEPVTSLTEAPPREEWNWKSMMRQPDFVTDEMVEAAKVEAKAKKGIAEVDDLVLEAFEEGLSAQILHVGPFSEEGPTIEQLHAFIAEQGYVMRGIHHEIYLSDPRRSAPERWRTIIRQPIEKL
ncbi:MAG: GyrI-like domain-containing protein [Candidatus Bathyarchaeota archaeon]|nr:GyrI-like domain-containing protein [Candidatus Bathyarchaeota archaeon]